MPFEGFTSEAGEPESAESFTLCPVCSGTGLAPNKLAGSALSCWCCGGQVAIWQGEAR